MKLAIIYLMKGEYKESEKHAKIAVEINGNYDKAYSLLSSVLFLQGRYKDVIDLGDLKDIKQFKETFISNIKYPPLFGKIKLNNENLVKAELTKINNNLSSKINELEKYLELYPVDI